MSDKQAKRITIGPLLKPDDDIVRHRRLMWAAWMDECAQAQDSFVEGMMSLLPSKGQHG